MRVPSGVQTATASVKNYQIFVVDRLGQDSVIGGMVMTLSRPATRQDEDAE